MTRLIRAFAAFVVGLLIGGYSVLSQAETIAATPQTNPPKEMRYQGENGNCSDGGIKSWEYTSGTAACNSIIAAQCYPGRTVTGSGDNHPTEPTYKYDCRISNAPYSDLQIGGSKVLKCWDGSGNTTCPTIYTCPSQGGWTLSGQNCTRPDCAAGETRDPETGICSPPVCPAAGTAQSSGYFLMGPSPTSYFPGVTCAGNCLVSFNGYAPAAESISNGVKQYWAKGTWQYLGPSNTCSGGSATPGAQSSLPPDTCGPNQYYGTINNKPVCIDATTGQPANTNPAPTPSTTTTDKTTTTNPDGSTTDTTTTSNPDGSTTTTTTTTQPNGNSTTTTTTTPSPNDDPKKTFCEENPDSPICEEVESGAPAETGDLYTPETRTVADVLNGFKAKVQGAPFYSGAVNFLSISAPGGSCGGMTASVSVGWGQSFAIDLDSVLCGSTAQLVYSVLGIGVMLAAAWVAFRIAIL